MDSKITVTYTGDNVSAQFEGDCAGTWGLYTGSRSNANAWLLAGRQAMERRWLDVVLGTDEAHLDGLLDREYAQYRWLIEECPIAALAVMCAEWGAPS